MSSLSLPTRVVLVQSPGCVRLLATAWTTVCRASLSFTISQSFLTLVHWVDDDIQPSHPLSPASPPPRNLTQHQGLFQWVSSSHQEAKVLELQFQHQSFQWVIRVYFLGLTGLISLLSKGLSRVFSSIESINSLVFSLLPSLWSNSHICTWLLEKHSFDYTDLYWQSDVAFNMLGFS